ncbi:V-type proton ATPase subunit [Armadillidium vulgare]|nr:V-type proton ATPase subunit [Armadillidium vulgare]
MLWRVCRGNAFVRQQDIPTPLPDPITVLSQTNDHRHRVLVAAAKHLRVWFIKVRKIKGIYFTLNKFNFDVTNKCLIAEAWIPEIDLTRIKMALCKGAERSGSTMEPILNRMDTRTQPPTFHRRNKFTSGFQNLIDAYAICTYREINPVLQDHKTEFMLNPADPSDYERTPYPMGMDPIWQLSLNKITFQNSFKMKISVIVGIIHMTFGIVLSFLNYRHFKKTIDIVFQFIPQIIFLMGLFGYLCFMVVFKWFKYSGLNDSPYLGRNQTCDLHGTRCAPSVLIMFIDMALLKKEEPFTENNCDCQDPYMYPNQYNVQVTLILICVIMVPILLLPKPLILKKQHEKRMKLRSRESHAYEQDIGEESTQENSSNGKINAVEGEGGGTVSIPVQPEEEEEKFEFSEVFIHQAIHTIEFVLGCISHTASYLRLWALSLAHAQLSEVLWMMIFRIGWSSAQNSCMVKGTLLNPSVLSISLMSKMSKHIRTDFTSTSDDQTVHILSRYHYPDIKKIF